MTPKKIFHLHFVGIGGIGMSGIAEVFLNQGFRVSGSDLGEGDNVKRLRKLGAVVHIGHRSENIEGADVVVISSAVRPDNPEVVCAKQERIPVIPRAEMLGELMRGKTGIAVAGTHGKTTTTTMMSSVLTAAKLDPTIIIGGIVNALGGNAKLGQGTYVVAEADESDGSFLHLPATYSIVTNIDTDHMDHYGSLENLDAAFTGFIGKLPFYGFAAVCGEDAGVRRLLTSFTKPIVTYGLTDEWDVYASDVLLLPEGANFEVWARDKGDDKHRLLGRVELKVSGRHNVLNATAVVAIAHGIGIPFQTIAEGLREFAGVRRRFEIIWRGDKRAIVDDYGHHPTELAATLAVARRFWQHGRVVAVFQPHRYTRTLHCREGFLSCFRDADVVYVTDIYSAGEDPIPGVDTASLVKEMQRLARPGQEIHYIGDLEATYEAVESAFRDGDLAIFLGAGSITKLPRRLAEYVQSRAGAVVGG